LNLVKSDIPSRARQQISIVELTTVWGDFLDDVASTQQHSTFTRLNDTIPSLFISINMRLAEYYSVFYKKKTARATLFTCEWK
jgi:hypothetical protein